MLTIYDISDREVIKEEPKKQCEHKIDIRHLKNGIYFIQVENKIRTLKGKLVKINGYNLCQLRNKSRFGASFSVNSHKTRLETPIFYLIPLD